MSDVGATVDRRITHSPLIVAYASRLWREGLSVRAIARQLKISVGAVAGLSRRRRGEFPGRGSPIKARSLAQP